MTSSVVYGGLAQIHPGRFAVKSSEAAVSYESLMIPFLHVQSSAMLELISPWFTLSGEDGRQLQPLMIQNEPAGRHKCAFTSSHLD